MQNENLKENQATCRDEKYDDNVDNEIIKIGEETFRNDYSIYIADQAIS